MNGTKMLFSLAHGLHSLTGSPIATALDQAIGWRSVTSLRRVRCGCRGTLPPLSHSPILATVRLWFRGRAASQRR
jgi:hypothetical protein